MATGKTPPEITTLVTLQQSRTKCLRASAPNEPQSACPNEPAIKFKMADDGSKTSSENVRPANILPGALFLTGVTLASMVGGFGYAIGQARRRSPGSFDQRQQEGVKLAVRALGWGTVLAVSGVGFLVFGVKTALGVKDAKEFGLKMKGILPTKDGKFVSYFESWRIPRNKGRGNMDEWPSLSSKSESPKITEK